MLMRKFYLYRKKQKKNLHLFDPIVNFKRTCKDKKDIINAYIERISRKNCDSGFII